MSSKKFTSVERAYLLSLDAVESVSESYITYSEAFKAKCMRLYKEGASPARIFREAGLDPKIIGYKRIERSVARWRQAESSGRVYRLEKPPLSLSEKRNRIVREIFCLKSLITAKEGDLRMLDECSAAIQRMGSAS